MLHDHSYSYNDPLRKKVAIKKPYTSVVRYLLQICIYGSMFNNLDMMQLICGPFTISPSSKASVLWYLIVLDGVRVFFPFVISWVQTILRYNFIIKPSIKMNEQSNLKSAFKSCTFKYVIIFLFKLWLILYQSHRYLSYYIRYKFYLHTIVIELILIVLVVISDLFRKPNQIAEVIEIIVIDSVFRLSIVYEVTRTFCPNLILYYFITNLLILCLSQVESQSSKFGFSNCLYVKHDVYRILVVTFCYFGLFSLLQINSYGLKMIVIFAIGSKYYYTCIVLYNQNQFQKSQHYLAAISLLFIAIESLAMLSPNVNNFLLITVK